MRINNLFFEEDKVVILVSEISFALVRDVDELKLKDYYRLIDGKFGETNITELADLLIISVHVDGKVYKGGSTLTDTQKTKLIEDLFSSKNEKKEQTQAERVGATPKSSTVTIDTRYTIGKFMRFYNYKLDEVLEMRKKVFEHLSGAISAIRSDEYSYQADFMDAAVLLNTPGGEEFRKTIKEQKEKEIRKYVIFQKENEVTGFDNIMKELRGGV